MVAQVYSRVKLLTPPLPSVFTRIAAICAGVERAVLDQADQPRHGGGSRHGMRKVSVRYMLASLRPGSA
jgi:hypothetical protein